MKKLVTVWMLIFAGSTFAQTASGDIVGELVSLKKQVVLLNKVVNEILNTPIQNETKVSKNWEELSPLEKFRLTK